VRPPILTLTLNPSVDVSTAVTQVVPTRKLRCEAPTVDPGGGGINVARVARRLGADATAVFTSGGANGTELERLLAAEGVPAVPVPIAGATRFALAVEERSTALQFRFGLPGPALDPAEVDRTLDTVRSLVTTGGWVVLSGALPGGVATDCYARAATSLRAVGAHVALDASGPALTEALRAGVDLVKPNLNELESIVGRPLSGVAAYRAAAREALELGDNGAVAVSLGPVGALIVTREEPRGRIVRAPAVRTRSTVGAGDSMVAGLVVALSQGADPERALRWGVAAGSATTLAPGSRLCDRSDVETLLAELDEAGGHDGPHGAERAGRD
jgi:6-phosphofructokinase 2